MAKDIKLNSSEWCDLVFEGRNKKYGAYELRESSSKRHIVAFVTSIAFVGLFASIPTFLEVINAKNKDLGGIDEAFTLSALNNPDEIQEGNIIRQETVPPTPPTRATIQFTPPTITDDINVNEQREMRSIDELNKEKDLQISKVTNEEGSRDPHAPDPIDVNRNNVIIENKEPEKTFITVEQMPKFPGGDAELMRFISSNLKYPTIAAENGIEGRVVVRFVVGKDGNVSDIQVLRSIDPSCDKEATRVVKMMPKWIPGMQNGRPVAVYYTLPILFKLQR